MAISVAVPMGFLGIIIILVGCLYHAVRIRRSANARNRPSSPYSGPGDYPLSFLGGGSIGGGYIGGSVGGYIGGSVGGCDD